MAKNILIKNNSDIQYAAFVTKEMVEVLGFKKTACVSICTAVSELVSNIRKYAEEGNIIIEPISSLNKKGIQNLSDQFSLFLY